MGKRTKERLLIAIAMSAITSFASAIPHAPIVISGDAQLTTANGVVNPGAAGTGVDPFVVRDWSIDAAGTGICIRVTGTSKFVELRNIVCTNAAQGIVFANVRNGKILDSSISRIRGAGTAASADADSGSAIDLGACTHITVRGNTISQVFGGTPAGSGGRGGMAWGTRFVFSEDVLISNNRYKSLFGSAGASGAKHGAGGAGGSAAGIFGVFSSRVVLMQNLVETVAGGASGDGRVANDASTGGSSGTGGDASGIALSGVRDVIAVSNSVFDLHGGFAGKSADAAPDGAAAGSNGGRGGNAIGMLWFGVTNLASDANVVQRLFAAPGAAGGAGNANGGAPGRGGDGGEAAGHRFDGGKTSTAQFNNFSMIRGGIGGSGGNATDGSQADGGSDRGGRGGAGVGLHYVGATDFLQSGNATNSNDGGFGGPGNDQAGSSLPVLIE